MGRAEFLNTIPLSSRHDIVRPVKRRSPAALPHHDVASNSARLHCVISAMLHFDNSAMRHSGNGDMRKKRPRPGCCEFNVEWHLCSRQIYCSRVPDVDRSPQATLLRRSGVMRRMSRAYHASREEGRSLSDGEERPDASMYLQQFAPFWNNSKLLARPSLQHLGPASRWAPGLFFGSPESNAGRFKK